MKVFLIVFTCAWMRVSAQAAQNDNLEKCNIATKACSEKLNVTYQKYNDYIQALPEGGEKIQLFSECFLRQLGYLNNNGEILYEDLKKTPYPGVPSDKYSNFVDLCKNQIGNSTAETSYKFSNCLMSNVNKFLKEQKPDPAKSGGTKSQQPKLTQQQQQQKAHEEYIQKLQQQQQQIEQHQQQTQQQLEQLRQQFQQQHEQYLQQLQQRHQQTEQIKQQLQERQPQLEEIRQQLQQQHDQMRQQLQERQQQLQKMQQELQQQFQQKQQQHDQVRQQLQQRQQQFQQIQHQLQQQHQQLHQQLSSRLQQHDQLRQQLQQREQLFQQQQQQVRQVQFSLNQQRALKTCSDKHYLPIYRIEDYHNALTKGGEKIQLFSECYLREMGYMNSNGEILYEEVKKIQAPCISPDKYSSIVDSCKNETGNNVSESSYKFYNCLSSNIQKFYKEQKLQAQQQHIQNQLQKQNRTIKACANKFKLSVQNVEDYSKVLAQGGPNVQSFSECYLRDSGYLDRNGNILYEEVKKTPPNGMLPDKYSSYVNLCKTEKGNSTAETSYKFLLCLQSNLNQTQQQVTEKPQVKQEPIVQPEKK